MIECNTFAAEGLACMASYSWKLVTIRELLLVNQERISAVAQMNSESFRIIFHLKRLSYRSFAFHSEQAHAYLMSKASQWPFF